MSMMWKKVFERHNVWDLAVSHEAMFTVLPAQALACSAALS